MTVTDLDEVVAERGYLLSYHVVMASFDQQVLDSYSDYYRSLVLREHELSLWERELVWLGLLATVREELGVVHVDRAVQAGATGAECSTAVHVASLVSMWPTAEFASVQWQMSSRSLLESTFIDTVISAGTSLGNKLSLLIAIAASGSQRMRGAYRCLLSAYFERGGSPRRLSEVLLLLVQPCGANTLLWASDVWYRSAEASEVPFAVPLGDIKWPVKVEEAAH